MKPVMETVLVMLAQLAIKPGKCAEFLDYTIENLPISRGAAGNLRFDILIDEARPDTVLFYEEWQSAEAQQAYMAWRVARGDLTTLLAFLDGEPKFTALQRVAG